MEMERQLRISSFVTIPSSEVHYRFSRSSGAGGQHVNKVSTRVELLFDIRNSPSLTQHRKDRIMERLKSVINDDGVLTLSSQESRSQWRNREDVTQRFVELLSGSLKVHPRRVPTKATRASHEERLRRKAHTSRKKERRRNEIE